MSPYDTFREVHIGNGSGYGTDRNISACRLLHKVRLFSLIVPPGVRFRNRKMDFMQAVQTLSLCACGCCDAVKHGTYVLQLDSSLSVCQQFCVECIIIYF
jgi:hypothetical protein